MGRPFYTTYQKNFKDNELGIFYDWFGTLFDGFKYMCTRYRMDFGDPLRIIHLCE